MRLQPVSYTHLEPSAMEVVEEAARRAGDKLVVPDFSLLSVGKVTRGAALLTCGTALRCV